MRRVTDIEVLEDLTARSRPDEGFIHVRRYRARNVRDDGTHSPDYRIDVIDRPSLDAVAIAVWARTSRGIEVLTRRGLRPAALFRRDKHPALPEPAYLTVEEIVAGVVEPGERGPGALVHRCVEEVREEAGIDASPESITSLGGAVFMLPGTASEKIHLFACEVARPDAPNRYPSPGTTDGSPLEEGAELVWRTLDEAISACTTGEIEDAKTEIALRRLAERLGRAGAEGRTRA